MSENGIDVSMVRVNGVEAEWASPTEIRLSWFDTVQNQDRVVVIDRDKKDEIIKALELIT